MNLSKIKEVSYQFVETRLKDETYLLDDEEALVQYQVKKAEPKVNLPGSVEIEAVILVGPDGNLTDEDVFALLEKEDIEAIETEILEDL
jgi:hypothetical protein